MQHECSAHLFLCVPLCGVCECVTIFNISSRASWVKSRNKTEAEKGLFGGKEALRMKAPCFTFMNKYHLGQGEPFHLTNTLKGLLEGFSAWKRSCSSKAKMPHSDGVT